MRTQAERECWTPLPPRVSVPICLLSLVRQVEAFEHWLQKNSGSRRLF